MVTPFSPRFLIGSIAALLLSLALPADSDAHGGEIHGEMDDASEVTAPAVNAIPVPAEASASTTPTSLIEPSTSQSLTSPSFFQRGRLITTTLWQAQPLEGGEIVGALIFTAPFALTSLKRRAQTKTALR